MANSTELARLEPVLLAALRIVAGVLFLSHGLVKLFGFPSGAAPGQQALLSLMGIGAVIELVTGTLITLGLFTRAAAFIAAGEMAVGLLDVPRSRQHVPCGERRRRRDPVLLRVPVPRRRGRRRIQPGAPVRHHRRSGRTLCAPLIGAHPRSRPLGHLQ